MPIVHSLTDEEVPDHDRREKLFGGDLFVYSPRPTALALVAASRVVLEQMLGQSPDWALTRLSSAEFGALFDAAARNLRAILPQMASSVLAELGCELSTTFVGVPALVASTEHGLFAGGTSVVQHPHRDTWFGASPSEVNWWLPVFDLGTSAALAFHPAYWDVHVENSSSAFRFPGGLERRGTGPVGGGEPLDQPRALHPIDLSPEIRISCPASGAILSSVAQLYSLVPNETSRVQFLAHFRTVSAGDIRAGRGAPNADARAEGTSLPAFVRCSDFSPMPDELVRLDLEHRRVRGSVGRVLD